MSLRIQYPHDKPLEQARDLAEQVARQMKQEFGMDYEWDDDVLNFQRPGVSGQLTVAATEVVVEAKLGFLLSALKPRIESEVRAFLKQHFG